MYVRCHSTGVGVQSKHTSAPGAIRAVAVAALDAGTDYLAVDVLRRVGVDVAGAAAAVRDFGCGYSHCDSHKKKGKEEKMGLSCLEARSGLPLFSAGAYKAD